MKKILLLIMILVKIKESNAQNNFVANQILPASPEPSLFMKANASNVNLSTGALNTNIPLFDIKLNNYVYPISLSYSTNGLKVDEASSRVGLGWAINATGMITRSVKGSPDEFSSRLTAPINYENTDNVYYFLQNASQSNSIYDAQPDEFQFSFNGYSGKFVLDNNYIPRITSTSNLKVTVDINVTPGSTSGSIGLIKFTAPDGVKYQFGAAYEKTNSHNIKSYDWCQGVTKTAFFLDRIDLPTGENIIFNYSDINNRSFVGKTEELRISKNNGELNCTSCAINNGYVSQDNYINYSSKYINNISTSNGIQIYFDYENRPDISYDNRLKSMTVVGYKKYNFNYHDVSGSNTAITGRYFLTKLQQRNIITPNDQDSVQNYFFQYNNLTDVPLPGNGKQDYLGYYNGYGLSTGSLIPAMYNDGNSMNFSFRNPNPNFSKIGTLASIQYPTGGQQAIVYEANTKSDISSHDTYSYVTLTGVGTTTYTSYNFTVPVTQTAMVSTSTADAIFNDGYTAEDYVKTAVMWIYEGNTLIASRSCLGYTTEFSTVDLLAGHTYRLVLKVYSSTDNGFCTLTYKNNLSPIYDTTNISFPGLRVKQVINIDPFTSKNNSKYYTYANLSNLNNSSGSCSLVDFHSNYNTRNYCGDFYAFKTECIVDLYSSSSTSDVYNYAGSGSPFYYQNVIESDDLNLANGGTEYTFFYNDNGYSGLVLFGGDIYPHGPSGGQFPTLSGVINKTRVFNSNKEVVSETINDYETFIDMTNSVNAYYVRKRYEPILALPDRLDAFDVIKLTYNNNWIRHKSITLNTILQSNIQTQKTDYYYGSNINILPSYTISLNSKNEQVKTETNYPTDFTNVSVYNEMVSRNIIQPVVQQKKYINNTLLQSDFMNFKLWDNNLLLPLSIQQQKAGGQLETHFQFNKYGANGRILEQQKNNNEKEVFLWAYNNTYPVLKATGTTHDVLSQYISQSQLENVAANIDNQSLEILLNSARSYLPNAFVETYSYKPLVGMTRKVDASAHSTYFEYDGFNRLKTIRDQDYNILKQYKYAYTDASIGSNIVPIYLNEQQSSNIQKNDCSSGYGSWVNYTVPVGKYCSFISVADANTLALNDIAASGQIYANKLGSCTLCASCIGVSNRCVNGNCQSGIKVYTGSTYDYNMSAYICTYHYEWSDGYWSSNFTESSSYNCLNQNFGN